MPSEMTIVQTAADVHDSAQIIQISDGNTLLMWLLISPFSALWRRDVLFV
jgi:hypothetical protein